MYGNDARERITSPWPVIIDCDQISPNSLADHLPEESILTPERNDLWLRGTHHWKADELAKALTFIAKHPMDLDVIVTSDTAPTKALNDAIGATERSEVHDFQVPKDAAAYAKQLRQWLDRRERLLDTTTAKRLISACESKPAAAQGIAVTLAQTPVTRSIDWDLIKPLVDAAVADTRPVWELGQTLLTGDAHETLATMDRIDAEPFAVLRYLENRYRMMTLSASGLNADAICAHLPDANRWAPPPPHHHRRDHPGAAHHRHRVRPAAQLPRKHGPHHHGERRAAPGPPPPRPGLLSPRHRPVRGNGVVGLEHIHEQA